MWENLLSGGRDLGAVPVNKRQKPGIDELYGQSWAVVIGVNDYRHRDIADLHYAVADAEAVAGHLPDKGWNVTILLEKQATRQNIVDMLSGDMEQKAGPEDRLLVFFAGHGRDLTNRAGRTRGYLIPVDGDPVRGTARYLSMDTVKEWNDILKQNTYCT
ncbi:MAG: caspase family protein [Gammaproteobacteria bacterium]|nr:caspase family protein [Gammaproteobacteria bacterium]